MPSIRPPDDQWERRLHTEGYHFVAGIDEVGRGPLAGPVVAAAVILDRDRLPPDLLDQLGDSKAIAARRRTELAHALQRHCPCGVGWASVEDIDRINILQATFLAMKRALLALPRPADAVLVDGNRLPPDLPCPGRAIVKGDATCRAIAAASIVAKVTRDAHMRDLAHQWPGYGWERNAGYGTRQHLDAIAQLGITPHHRRSFAPIANRSLF